MTNHSKIAIIITAAGSSTRIGSGLKKEYIPYKNGTVLSNCVLAFLKAVLDNYEITNIVVTCPVDSIVEAKQAIMQDQSLLTLLKNFKGLDINFTKGGATRQESVFNGLQVVNSSKSNPDCVLIHDGARPFVSERIINDVIEATLKYGAAVPGITPIDTQKEVDENGFIVRHLIRKNLCAVQTPQGFSLSKIFEAHQKVATLNKSESNCREFTDDSEIWGYCYGEGTVKVVPGDVNNIKITYPSDLNRL